MQGEIIRERYRIEEVIGRGTVGVVYRATDVDLDRPVAVKVVDPELVAESRFAEQYGGLARTAAGLHHPNVVVIHDVIREQEQALFVVMEYLEGKSLDVMLDENERWPHPQIAKVLTDVAAALDYAHAKGIYHLGLKPSNVIVEPNRAVVTDFCVLQSLRILATHPIHFNRGLPPAYMAPEQIEDSLGNEGPWTDIYVLGILAYQLVAGRLPFRTSTPQAIIYAHLEKDVPRPPGCPPEVFEALRQALAKKPSERFEKATAFVEALLEGVKRIEERGEEGRQQTAPQKAASQAAPKTAPQEAEIPADLREAAGPTLQALLERYHGDRRSLSAGNVAALIDILDPGEDLIQRNRVVPVDRSVFHIGRDPDEVDLAIVDPRVSRVHCTLSEREDGSLYVQDENSSNGTYLNGQPLEPQVPYPVFHGAELELGPVRLKIYLWKALLRPSASAKAKQPTEITESMPDSHPTLTEQDLPPHLRGRFDWEQQEDVVEEEWNDEGSNWEARVNSPESSPPSWEEQWQDSEQWYERSQHNLGRTWDNGWIAPYTSQEEGQITERADLVGLMDEEAHDWLVAEAANKEKTDYVKLPVEVEKHVIDKARMVIRVRRVYGKVLVFTVLDLLLAVLLGALWLNSDTGRSLNIALTLPVSVAIMALIGGLILILLLSVIQVLVFQSLVHMLTHGEALGSLAGLFLCFFFPMRWVRKNVAALQDALGIDLSVEAKGCVFFPLAVFCASFLIDRFVEALQAEGILPKEL